MQEWDGDTADSAFAADLTRGFELIRRIALPSWPDTAHDLTLWRRRGGGGGSGAVTVAKGASAAPLTSMPAGDGGRRAEIASGLVPPSLESCSACCGASKLRPAAAGAVAGSVAGGPLRRCRLCREVQYCCTACAEAHSQAHAGIHAMRLIWWEGQGGAPRGASGNAGGGDGISVLAGAEYEDFHPFGLR